MKKRILIITSIIVIIIMCVFICINVFNKDDDNPPDLPDNTVAVSFWNDNGLYKMFLTDVQDISRSLYCTTTFSSKKSFDEIVATNKDDYIGDMVYHTVYDEKFDSCLYLYNNNYFVIYQIEDSQDGINKYIAKNCISTFNLENTNSIFPCPVELDLDYGIFKTAHEKNHNILNILYDNYKFEEACTFYERLSDDIVSIDKDKKCITVTVYNNSAKKIESKFLTLNFSSKTISWIDKDGNKIEVDGTEEKPKK